MSQITPGRENRLAQESSPYLLLHKTNPVDWYPWGAEAFERAREEGKPIFLSVGYSTCYWCHVMERESFTDPAIGRQLAEGFVSIKLDREERPDVDEIYMTATQILTGQGGWPNSVFLTPDLKPFYAGTYFPPEDRHGRPGFSTLLAGLARAWGERRTDVELQAEEVADAMAKFIEGRFEAGDAPPSAAVFGRAVTSLTETFDPQWGGFGGAPKFPTPANLLLLLEALESHPPARPMLEATLDQMARGGIYDQLGGGFHRYATDREWKVPHFEKMLYDNGLLLEVYGRWFEATGDSQAERVIRQTAAFLARELTSPEGGFWSALDAETEGREGAFYAWSRDQLAAALDDETRTFLAPLLGLDGRAFFEGDWVLHLPETLAAQAARRRQSVDELRSAMAPGMEQLFDARAERPRPLTDDKILTDWNGTAIAGLAVAGRVLEDEVLIAQAARAARFVLAHLRAADGTLLHSWRQGEAKIPAMLPDYAFFVAGLLALAAAEPEEVWRAAAEELTEQQITRLRAPEGGSYVAAEGDDLLFRSRDVFDGALPAANSVAILNLLRLAEGPKGDRWREEAEAALAAFGPQAEALPQAARTLSLAARRWHGADLRAEAEGHAPPPLEAGDGSVEVDLAVEPAGEDGWRAFELKLEIAAGWHLYAPDAADQGLRPVSLSVVEGELAAVEIPAGEPLAVVGEPVPVLHGGVTLRGRLRSDGPVARLVLAYQACDDARCLAPARIELTVD
ncbi:MAG: thioredoxin domain-containing protein [Acidobacteriota bacterium]